MTNQFKDVFFMPHSHLDLTWLGTPAECEKRNSNIIRAAVNLLRRNADFRFCVENVRPLEKFLEAYPGESGEIQALLRSGRLEAGGTYADVAHDYCFDESLVRNLTHGQGWLERTLGVRTRIAREEDVLAHAAQTPQLLRRSGIDYYKISRGPAGVFRWAAPDGSEITAALFEYNHSYHFKLAESPALTEKNLGAYLDWMAQTMARPAARLLVMDGDDGTPPNGRLIGVVRAWNGAGRRPALRMATATEFLDAGAGEAPPPLLRGDIPGFWGAVLLFEVEAARKLHRAEVEILAAEKLGAAVALIGASPRPRLDRAWRNLLAAQDHNWGGKRPAHDGPAADRDKRLMLDAAIADAQVARDASLHALAAHVRGQGGAPRALVFNPLSWPRTDRAEVALPHPWDGRAWEAVDERGEISCARVIPAGAGHAAPRLVFMARDVPPLGCKAYELRETPRESARGWDRCASDTIIENSFYRLELNGSGRGLSAVYDKALGRRMLGRPGPAAAGLPFPGLVALGGRFSAPPPEFYESVENLKAGASGESLDFLGAFALPWQFRRRGPALVRLGPAGTELLIRGEFLGCPVRYEIILYDEIKRVDVRVSVAWRGKPGMFLALLFPLPRDLDTYHVNTPFYVHRMGAEAEGFWKFPGMPVQPKMRGVQHWFSASGQDVTVTCASPWRLWDFTLGPAAPLLASDNRGAFFHGEAYLQKGVHQYEFSFFTAAGDWQAAQSPRRGAEAVYPLVAALAAGDEPGATLPRAQSFCTVAPENAAVTALKNADHGPGVVVRVFEAHGRATAARLEFPCDVAQAFRTDLLENNEHELRISGSSVEFDLGAYEICTVRVVLALSKT